MQTHKGDKTQHTCNDLEEKFNHLESRLKLTTKENTELRKSLHALQEQITTNTELNGKNIVCYTIHRRFVKVSVEIVLLSCYRKKYFKRNGIRYNAVITKW